MATVTDVQTWKGMKVVDPDGDKVGTIEDVYLDRHTGEPAWATVKTGLFGLKHSFVPIRDAQPTDDNELRVPFQKEQVKDAPNIDPGGELSPEQERELYEYWGRSDYGDWQGEDRTTDLALPDEPRAETRTGEGARADDDDAPVIVGVRLRRVIVVSPDDDVR